MNKKNWQIQEPHQMKFGGWYSHVKDPDTQEIVLERLDYSKQMCLQGCIDWCVYKNKELEATPEPVVVPPPVETPIVVVTIKPTTEETPNANPTAVGPTVDNSSASNV
jgi:hypothetical protein